MNLKSFWERHRAQRWAGIGSPRPKYASRKRFQPLTREESIAILDDTIQWLLDETRAALLLSDTLIKHKRLAELRGRDKSIARDFHRLIGQYEK